MANQFIIRRTAAEWTAGNYTLLPNQLGVESNVVNNVETDTGYAKIGDGVTAWNDLPYFNPVPAGDTDANIGYLTIPQNLQSDDYELVLTDSGKHIYETGASKAVTVPANSAVAFPIGTAVTVVNSNAADMTVVITTDTLEYVNVGAVTTITIPQYNMITLLKVAATTWLASGTAGVTTV